MNEPVRELSAADALAIIKDQQAATAARIGPRIGHFFLIWGAVWLVTGLLFYGTSLGWWSAGVANWATLAVVTLGMAASAATGIRSGRGVAGTSVRQGLLYGLTWPAVMVALAVLIVGLVGLDLPGDTLGVLVPALIAFVSGALYAVSGAVWVYLPNLLTGLWVVACGVGSLFAGVPANALVLGVGIGGALLGVGLWETVRAR
jgi:hypothetical protein